MQLFNFVLIYLCIYLLSINTLVIYISIYSFEVYFQKCICSFISVFICFMFIIICVTFYWFAFIHVCIFDMLLFSFLFICFISMYLNWYIFSHIYFLIGSLCIYLPTYIFSCLIIFLFISFLKFNFCLCIYLLIYFCILLLIYACAFLLFVCCLHAYWTF